MKKLLTQGQLSVLIVFAVLIIDQIIKILVKTNMYWHESIRITDWFYIYFTENNGMAFGMEIFGKLFLTTFRIVSVGADIEVVVLEIDKENRRLSLGHKQLEENPWNEFENQYSVDSIHEGTITEMTDKGAVVALGENIEGFCPARQLVKEDGTTPKTGDKLNFKILEFSKATKRITLSHLRTYEEAKRAEIAAEKAEKRAAADATKSTVKKINASVEKTTLGDIAGLAALKSAMEAAEAKSAKKAAAKKEDEE